MENPETPRGKPGELRRGGPTAGQAARVRGMGAVSIRNHARELSIMSRGSHLVFSRDALKRASRSTNPPFRLPPLQGTAAPVRIRGVTAGICKGATRHPLDTALCLRSSACTLHSPFLL